MKMLINLLIKIIEENRVMTIQEMIDKLNTVKDKEAKDYHGRISTDCESIYNNCATYRIMVKQ